jgi:hypothetical protein
MDVTDPESQNWMGRESADEDSDDAPDEDSTAENDV